MIGIGLVCGQDHQLAGRIGHVGIGRDVKNGEMSVSSRVRIVHHEPATGGIIRIECQSQEPLLTAGRYPATQVQKWSRQQAAILYQADAPGLLHHEQTAQVTRGTGQVQG